MKKILLIGKSGQLGSALMKEAPFFGFQIIAFERKELDILNQAQVKNKIKTTQPDFLINTAAYHVVPRCEENPLKAMEVNFAAPFFLAKVCRAAGIKFITFSTDYVFDGETNRPYRENAEPNPLQIYGVSKLAGEYAVLNSYPEDSFIVRTCGLYGGKKGSREKGGNSVLNFLQAAKKKDIIEVSREQFASPTYAGHLSGALLQLLKTRAAPGIYHLVNEGYCNWSDFAKEIFRLSGIRAKIKPVDRGGRDGEMRRPKFSVLGNFKAKALGIKLPPWQKGLRDYLNYELN